MLRPSLPWLGLLGVALTTLACSGGSDFTSRPTTDGGAGAAGGGGTAAAGGSAGSGGSAGAGGAAGSAGTGGSVGGGGSGGAVDAGVTCADDAGCNAGEYCGDDSTCHSCADISHFHFGKPEPLDQINAAHPDDYLRYPRAIDDHTLIYTVEGPYGLTRAIWVTGDLSTSAGAAASSVSDGSGAPLLSEPPGSGPLSTYNFFFDTGIPNTLNREIIGATIDNNGSTTAAAVLPAPINGSGSNYSFALAAQAGRAWWEGTRAGAFQVFTAGVLAGASPNAVQISLTTAPANCPLDILDVSPWASPDGKLLLFDSSEHYVDCNDKYTPLDMFYALPDKEGKVSKMAEQIDIDLQNINDSQPSLSPDMCWLYFASDRNGAKTLRLYRAHRR